MPSKIGKAKLGRGKSERTNKHKSSITSIIDNIIYNADIILEVIDSRFIDKTRNPELEKKVKNLKKKLVYVFNKSDLIDVKTTRAKSEIANLKPCIFFSSKDRKAGAKLKQIIKSLAKGINNDDVNVGVIGYPNVGKSSMINLLVGRAVSRTSSEAGFTKGMQKVKISSGLYLIDSPGIIPDFEKTSGNIDARAKQSYLGAVTWDRTKNPEMVITRIENEFPGLLEKFYNIDAEKDVEVIIEKLGRRLNYLKKGNQVDEQRTAKRIIKDWQEGKIKV